MVDTYEQLSNLIFLLGRSSADAVDMSSAVYKERALKWTQVFEWYLYFKRGEILFEND